MSGVAVVHGWGPASVWGGYHEAGGCRGRAGAFIHVTSCVTRVWVTLPRPQTPPVTPQGPVAHDDKGTRENPALCWAQRKDPRIDPAVPGGSWVGLEALVQDSHCSAIVAQNQRCWPKPDPPAAQCISRARSCPSVVGWTARPCWLPAREKQAAENPHPPWWGRKPWADPASSAARDWEPGTSREQEDGTLHCAAGASTEIPSSDPGARAEPGPGRGQRGPTLPMAQGNRRSSRPGS